MVSDTQTQTSRRLTLLLAAAVGLGGAVVWGLVAAKLGMRLRPASLAIGVAVGAVIARAVRGPDDRNLPLFAAGITAASVLLAEYLLLCAFANELTAHLLRDVTPPFGAYEFLSLLVQTANAQLVLFSVLAVVVAAFIPARRLRRPARWPEPRFAKSELPSLSERIRRVEASPKPRASGPARVLCSHCNELVDADTTTLEGSGIVCHDCARARHRRQKVRVEQAEKPAKGRVVGGARVLCAECRELVDANDTVTVEGVGIVCTSCEVALEGAANRNASYRG